MGKKNNQTNGNTEPTEMPEAPEETGTKEEQEATEVIETIKTTETKVDKLKEAIKKWHIEISFSKRFSELLKSDLTRWEKYKVLLHFIRKFVKRNLAIIVLIISTITLGFTCLADRRAEEADKRAIKLFFAQMKSLIDIDPNDDIVLEPENMATLFFEYVNYSGFVATNVIIDIKFGPPPHEFLLKWLVADPKKTIKVKELMPGERRKDKYTASLNLNNKFGEKDKYYIEGYPFFFWAQWKNENGSTSEIIYEYRLNKTKDVEHNAYYFKYERKITEKL